MVVVCCIHIDSIGIICSFAEEDFRVEMFEFISVNNCVAESHYSDIVIHMYT